MENQPKLHPPSLQPSVAISRSYLSCWGNDFRNAPYLSHLSLVYCMMRGLPTNCLAYNVTYVNWLIEEKAGLYVGWVKKILAYFQKVFLHGCGFTINKQPCCCSPDQHGWEAACTDWANEQIFLSFHWITIMGILSLAFILYCSSFVINKMEIISL